MDNNQAFSNTLDILIANTNIIELLTMIIVISAIIGIIIYVAVKQNAKTDNCNKMKGLYSSDTNIVPVLKSNQLNYTIGDNTYETRLRDMYIKSSYNSCSAGNYKDDWVSTCALNEVLKQGCRFIDFEIYSINHEPVVATSTTTDYYTKETWNSIPFKEITKIIKKNAFIGDYVPNPTDPLLVHLRFKSNDILMYNKLAKIIRSDLDSYTLDNKYSCGYADEGNNPANVLDATFISNVLKQKVIFIVDGNSNNTYMNTDMNEFVNLSTSCTVTPSITEYRKFSAENSETNDSLTAVSKAGEIIILPDLNKQPINIDCTSSTNGFFNYGSQIVGMCFQLKDVNLNNYINFFNAPSSGNAPCAFILKDTSLIDPDSSETYPSLDKMEMSTQTHTSKSGYTFEYPVYNKKDSTS